MATTDVSVCANALLMVGAEIISSFTEGSKEANVCSGLYPTTRDTLLQSYPWRFSIGEATLARLAATPNLDDWQYAYQLPTHPKCLRVITAEGNINYAIFEDKLYCNQTAVKIYYQFQPDEQQMPSYFLQCLQFEMASILSIALFEDENKATLFENKLGRWERKARAIDSQQYPSRGLPNGSYVITGVRS
jgi:hypothetical protein